MEVAVIGAGWAGCAAAIEATRLGHNVTLLDSARVPGGRARRVDSSIKGQPLALDNGQHILIGAYTHSLALMRRVGVDPERALALYDEALALLPPSDRRAQKPGLMMASIYRTLLREIQADGYQVLHQRVSLTPLRKFWLAWKTQALGRVA